MHVKDEALDVLREQDANVDTVDAWYADGYLGQYIVIVPETGVVGVRQTRSRPDYDGETQMFRDFIALVAALQAK